MTHRRLYSIRQKGKQLPFLFEIARIIAPKPYTFTGDEPMALSLERRGPVKFETTGVLYFPHATDVKMWIHQKTRTVLMRVDGGNHFCHLGSLLATPDDQPTIEAHWQMLEPALREPDTLIGLPVIPEIICNVTDSLHFVLSEGDKAWAISGCFCVKLPYSEFTLDNNMTEPIFIYTSVYVP